VEETAECEDSGEEKSQAHENVSYSSLEAGDTSQYPKSDLVRMIHLCWMTEYKWRQLGARKDRAWSAVIGDFPNNGELGRWAQIIDLATPPTRPGDVLDYAEDIGFLF
jgi:hypothetical protein